MAASHNVNAAKAFVARFEGAEKTVAASRNVGALLNFRTHPCMERACPFRSLSRNPAAETGFLVHLTGGTGKTKG